MWGGSSGVSHGVWPRGGSALDGNTRPLGKTGQARRERLTAVDLRYPVREKRKPPGAVRKRERKEQERQEASKEERKEATDEAANWKTRTETQEPKVGREGTTSCDSTVPAQRPALAWPRPKRAFQKQL